VPSLLAVVFAAIALPATGRGEVKGRGLAVGGLVVGIIGLLAGIGIWILLAVSPGSRPVTGAQLSKRDRATLESMSVVNKGEEIELFASSGVLSVKEGGTVITATQLVLYGDGQSPQKAPLAGIESIDFTAGQGWLNDGQFVLAMESGKVITFTVTSQDGGDKLFHKVLTKKVTQARQAVGKSVRLMGPEAESEDSQQAGSDRSPSSRPGHLEE
jgi:hypothetical protein